ncbi:MAG TPA: sulfatase [Vicinamibacterales bacterium]|nr:sulfatase [Vicinamibacterales bacterium]
MTSDAIRRVPRFDRDLLTMAVVLGFGGGLAEGISQMVLQKLNVLNNVWYPIIWIAAVCNGLLVTGAGLLLAGALAFAPRARTAAVFLVLLLAFAPGIAWLLKEWIHRYSILVLAIASAAVFTQWIGRHDDLARRVFRRSVHGTLAVVLLTLVAIEGGARVTERVRTARLPVADASAPNVLLIIIDALRADRLSAYGHGRPTSPAIDRMAHEGALFEQGFSTSSYTLPSHASILTGLYSYQHGVEWGSSHHWVKHATLPELLQARGYRTGAFSGNTFWFTREHGFGQGFLHFDDFFHSFADMALRTGYGKLVARQVLWRVGYEDIPARKRATTTNQQVLRWLAHDQSHPFFVTINYMDVHDPYIPPQPYRNRFASRPDPGGLLNWELHVPETLTSEELQSELDAYDGSIAYVDDQVDALVAAIRQRYRDRELLVVITSDHGEEFGEHGGFLHGSHLYREAIRVPLIVWQPGRVPSGARISQPVTNAAIPATILDLIGAAGPPELARSLRPLWTDPASASDWPWPLIEMKHRPWESNRQAVHYGSLRSLVSPELHYIDHDTQGPQLYDWVNDPRETTDLIKRPEMQPAVERFRERLPGGQPRADRSAALPRR